MAYVYDNKTYRNLQQQVKENMENIAELKDLKLVGIDVAGIVADYSSLPSSAEQGQLYAVGSSSPYELYVYNDSSWVDFGEFPKAGPKGDQGPQGEPGRQGQRGLTGPQGPRGYTGAPGTPGQAGPQGEPGPQGPIGPQGPKGQDGTVSFDELTPAQLDMLKGPKGDKGDTGDTGPAGERGPIGPEGPQGPKGDTGEPSSIKVNGITYTSDASGLITLPDYPDEVAWGNIQGTLSNQTDLKNALDAKQDKVYFNFDLPGDIVQYGSYPIRTVYGGNKIIFENADHPVNIVGNIINLDIPTLTWGSYDGINGSFSAYGYNYNPDTVENCYRCWKAYIDYHNLKAGDKINLKLKYTDSAGELNTFSGTGVIHSDSFIDPVLQRHKIRLDEVNFRKPAFPGTTVSNGSFRIEPQYGQIILTNNESRIDDIHAQKVTNITIKMDVLPNDIIITPINSNFIGTDIARTANIKNVSGVNDGTNWTSLTIGSDTYGLGGGSSGEIIGIDIVRLGTTTLTQELADKIAAEPYKYYLKTQLRGEDYEIFSYAGIYLNELALPKMKVLIWTSKNSPAIMNENGTSLIKSAYYIEINNDTNVVTPEIKRGNGESWFNVLKSIPEELPIYQKNYIPTSEAVKNYVDAHSVDTSKLVTTDTDQNITAFKTFINNDGQDDWAGIYFKNKLDTTTDNRRLTGIKIDREDNLYLTASKDGQLGGMIFLSTSPKEWPGNSDNDVILAYLSALHRNSFYPIGTADLGNSYGRIWDTLYCNNLSDGTTTKTMTDILSGTTEEWTFTLSDGTTVTKNVKLG